MGDEYRWVFQPTTQVFLSTWISQKEDDGWTVSWPTADGKFEDLKALAVQQGFVVAKEKKEELAKRLGRNQSLTNLSKVLFAT